MADFHKAWTPHSFLLQLSSFLLSFFASLHTAQMRGRVWAKALFAPRRCLLPGMQGIVLTRFLILAGRHWENTVSKTCVVWASSWIITSSMVHSGYITSSLWAIPFYHVPSTLSQHSEQQQARKNVRNWTSSLWTLLSKQERKVMKSLG